MAYRSHSCALHLTLIYTPLPRIAYSLAEVPKGGTIWHLAVYKQGSDGAAHRRRCRRLGWYARPDRPRCVIG